MKTLNREIPRAAGLLAAVVFSTHLGYIFELGLSAAGLGEAAWAWLAVLLAQLLACAACGAAAARLRWPLAGWYLAGSFAAVGLFYLAAPFHQFAYISSGLWYGSAACAAGYLAARRSGA